MPDGKVLTDRGSLIQTLFILIEKSVLKETIVVLHVDASGLLTLAGCKILGIEWIREKCESLSKSMSNAD